MPDRVRIPLLDLRRLHAPLQRELEQAALRVLRSGRYVLGPELRAFEEELSRRLGVRHAVGLSSGSDALLVALMALGVGPGDEVVTTPFTFFATVGAIVRLGATPRFVDIDPHTLNLDVQAALRATGPRTRAWLPVHLFGLPVDLPEQVPVPVVEDACQAIGAAPLQGVCAALSFFPSKNLGGFGDGGALLTDDDEVAQRVRLLRVHGARPKYHHVCVGGNFRLDELQAALLRVKLPHLEVHVRARRRNAALYRERLRDVPQLELPPDEPRHTYHQFVIQAERRDALRAHLAERGIQTAVYYPEPLHLQPALQYLGHREGDFPSAERASRRVLALPVGPELDEREIDTVAHHVRAFYGQP